MYRGDGLSKAAASAWRRPPDRYLGGVWKRRRTGFEGVQPFEMDIAARDMMKKWQDEYPERRDELVRVRSAARERATRHRGDAARASLPPSAPQRGGAAVGTAARGRHRARFRTRAATGPRH